MFFWNFQISNCSIWTCRDAWYLAVHNCYYFQSDYLAHWHSLTSSLIDYSPIIVNAKYQIDRVKTHPRGRSLAMTLKKFLDWGEVGEHNIKPDISVLWLGVLDWIQRILTDISMLHGVLPESSWRMASYLMFLPWGTMPSNSDFFSESAIEYLSQQQEK